MNRKLDITYLSGGDEYFGANYGGTTVNTLARRGYAATCPNAGRLFSQLAFSVDMENAIMESIEEKGQDTAVAAAEYLKANPRPVAGWLDGVTTLKGEPALPAMRQALKLK
jgi:glycine betaine/proline transport system substrate-binding protein